MADIHFNHRLALAALGSGCASIRINPGNMSDKKGTEEVIRLARDMKAVIRIGANGGSLSRAQMQKSGGDRAAALACAVEEQLRILLDNSFEDIIISAKSSSVTETVRAIDPFTEIPFPAAHRHHRGRERDPRRKGAAGISLRACPGDRRHHPCKSHNCLSTDEVRVGYSILRALEIRHKGCSIISCPTCGRRRIDVVRLVEEVTSLLPKEIKD